MTCQKCHGLMGTQWDIDLRIDEPRCLVCGDRPFVQARRVDGHEIGSPPTCKECGKRPVATVVRHRAEHELRSCEICAEQNRVKQRAWKKG